jgi:hypothetical protein
LTQAVPPQSVLGAAHAAGALHTPATQACPVAQALPTAPQFAGSPCVLTQRPPVAVRPGRHTQSFMMALQYWSARHWAPPQLPGLPIAPEHPVAVSVVPGGQRHAPL